MQQKNQLSYIFLNIKLIDQSLTLYRYIYYLNFIMLGQYQDEEISSLLAIINHAQQKTLKESAIKNHKSLFNILKILSSYKQLTKNIPINAKNSLYNRIIMITKYFNPQTYHQWISAVHSLNEFIMSEASSNRCTLKNNENIKMLKSKQMQSCHNFRHKTGLNQFEFHGKDDRDLNLRNETISEFNRKNHSKFWGEAHHNHSFHSYEATSKNKKQFGETHKQKFNKNIHYISFEPEDQVFGETNKQNISIEDNQPTRTPFSRSFIHNLPTSSGSPFMLSKITNNTKQATVIEEDEASMEEWKSMVARADIFYEINLKFKSFSIIMANCEAFGEYRQLRQKASLFRKHGLTAKSFHILNIYRKNKQAEKNLDKLMQIHFKQKSLTKCFKILRANHQLKISQSTNIDYADYLKKFNYMNCQFLSSVLFKSGESSVELELEGDRDWTPKSIRTKANFYEETFDAEKMGILVENFNRIVLPRDFIEQFLRVKKQCLLRRCFKGLLSNKRTQQQKLFQCSKNHKKYQFQRLLSNTHNTIKKRSSILYIKNNNSYQTKSKVFNALLEIILSKKLYSKKQQFIRNQFISKKKIAMMTIWRQRSQRKIENKVDYHVRVTTSLNMIQMVFLKSAFRALQILNNEAIHQEKEANQLHDSLVIRSIFTELKTKVQDRKKYNKIKRNKRIHEISKYFKRWENKFKGKQLKQHLQYVALMVSFRTIRRQSEILANIDKLQNLYRQERYLRGFKCLKLFHLALQKLDKERIHRIESFLQTRAFVQFNRIVSHDIKIRKCEEMKRLNQEKYGSLLKYLRKSAITRAFDLSKASKITNRNFQEKVSVVQEKLKGENLQMCHLGIRKPKREILRFFGQLKTDYNQVIRKEQITSLRAHRALLNFISIQRQSQFLKQQTRKLSQKLSQQRRKSQGTLFLNTLKATHQKQQQRYKIALQIYRTKLRYRCIEVLVTKAAKRQQKIDKLTKIKSQEARRNSSKTFIQELKDYHTLRNKQMTLMKLIRIRQIRAICQRVSVRGRNIEEIQGRVGRSRCLEFVKKLTTCRNRQKKDQEVQQSLIMCLSKLFLMRFKNLMIRNMLNRKTQYMALKYHALKLQKKVFKHLITHKKKPKRVQKTDRACSILITDNSRQPQTFPKLKIYEHISTEYSSI